MQITNFLRRIAGQPRASVFDTGGVTRTVRAGRNWFSRSRYQDFFRGRFGDRRPHRASTTAPGKRTSDAFFPNTSAGLHRADRHSGRHRPRQSRSAGADLTPPGERLLQRRTAGILVVSCADRPSPIGSGGSSVRGIRRADVTVTRLLAHPLPAARMLTNRMRRSCRS